MPVATTLASVVICNLPVHDESMLNASSYMNVGIAAGLNGDMGESIDYLHNAIEARPDLSEAWVNLGRAYEQNNSLNKAIRCYKTALEIDPLLEPVDRWLGSVYEEVGNLQQAVNHYQSALILNPSDQLAREGLERLTNQPLP